MRSGRVIEERASAWCDRIAAPYRRSFSGVVVAVVQAENDFFASYGRVDAGSASPPEPSTLFEIGSITKVFTSLLLARYVLESRLALDAPIGEIRGEFAGAPAWITPRSLATHTSGLPRLPIPIWRVPFINPVNPYADFSGVDLTDWVSRYRPRRPPRGRPRYSNLGVGLLGYLLGLVAGTDYETALRDDVIRPLGLGDTTIRLNPDQRRRLATPHRGGGKPTPPWDFDALAGAGALRSSARDLVLFARGVTAGHRGDGAMSGAIVRTLEVQIPGRKGMMPDQCLGWTRFTRRTSDRVIFHHDGGTRGSSSAIYVAPDANVGVVVLANHGMGIRQMLKVAKSDPAGLVSKIAEDAA